ncbi:extracellular solute-binding protein [Pararhizobium haloflavum]|uniref:extracellular solute-binding protein n=1 Tax=Pararhizobium haloflavum TaxID=2037914 RepID=UPI000C175A9D|nr:extracellular solute-binding protein [Pararhizobium haloflavum]
MSARRALALSRRTLLKGAAASAGLWTLPITMSGAFAQNPVGQRLSGLSAFGELKYSTDFAHFDYVEPSAPKGGRIHLAVPTWLYNQNPQTFNTLNSFVLSGDAPPRMENCFDTLMVSALDEPDSLYCHAAEWVEISEDRNVFRFGLRPEARFHDGTQLSASDVAFSLNLLKSDGHPALATSLRAMERATALDDATVELTYDGRQSARAILAIAAMPILSELYYTANTFDSSTLDIPLSSGPYRPGRVESGRFIEYERVPDYWAADLPTMRGLNNFDTVRIEFFSERLAEFEAFKKGDIHWRQEAVAQVWSTGYTFPAIEEGRVVKAEFAKELRPSMQAWALNQRRPPFDDWRVRQAVNLCFDFEWTNAKLFYGVYSRSHSQFENSEFKAEGPPGDAEKALLDSLEADVPEGAYGEPAIPPVSDGSGRDRTLLREAARLLEAAGLERSGSAVLFDGAPLTLEILIQGSIFERLHAGFVQNMRRIGIDASIRLVDPAQYNARMTDYDFDMVMMAMSFGPTPTAESMDEFFSSRSATSPGTYNLPGVRAEVYDELLDRLAAVESREGLVTVMRVMDRVLRARLDWIPNWYSANHLVAYWDKFGFKEPKPDYGWPVEQLWWHDEEKAAAIGKA